MAILIIKFLFTLFNLITDIAVISFVIWIGYGLICHPNKELRSND